MTDSLVIIKSAFVRELSRDCFRRARQPERIHPDHRARYRGAFLATLSAAIGHYGPDQGAGFITRPSARCWSLFIWTGWWQAG